MNEKISEIQSISELHNYYGAGKPRHPLVTVIHYDEITRPRPKEEVFFRKAFYVIACKLVRGTMKYGKSHYDFSEGTLMFTAPGQVISVSPDLEVDGGWGLFIHPDLLHATALGAKMHQYSFFHYQVNEALHVSDEEMRVLFDCVEKIRREYSQNIDKHTHNLIVSNIELLLGYCTRFYERQFITRASVNNDLVQKFERLLNDYFSRETLVDDGLPEVGYFAAQLSLSPNYLSDLLNRYTGKTTQDHIHLQLTERAKTLLWGTEKSISEIAYQLGFEHPSHFTRLFKSKTGRTPSAYRNAG